MQATKQIVHKIAEPRLRVQDDEAVDLLFFLASFTEGSSDSKDGVAVKSLCLPQQHLVQHSSEERRQDVFVLVE